ncbi:MAG: tRNA (adenosine(37)-N6)-threonylcarbamoyltransferase complex dimerization subunit type 1 TsaB [Gammaproteobacteria bacterium]
MKILALETSTERCSAALLIDGEVAERAQTIARAHAELILPMVGSLLAEAGVSLRQLDALAFGRGPGGFTGVRVATAVVQGLAFGADRPVVPVSDLMALAAGTYRQHRGQKILACLDARMREVYWCAYETGAADDFKACMPEQLGTAETVQPPEPGSWFGAGSGFATYGKVLSAQLGTALEGQDAKLLPAARDIATLGVRLLAQGQVVSADAALPVYLRDRVAWPKSGL